MAIEAVLYIVGPAHQLSSWRYGEVHNFSSDKDRCAKCDAEKVVRERKILEVHIEKGMKDGHKITFRGESNQASLRARQGLTHCTRQSVLTLAPFACYPFSPLC